MESARLLHSALNNTRCSTPAIDHGERNTINMTTAIAIYKVSVNSTKLQCKWNTQSSQTSLMRKTIRLKFTLKNCDMYSFWLSDSKNGESHGFTAGGGPGLSPSGIDIID